MKRLVIVFVCILLIGLSTVLAMSFDSNVKIPIEGGPSLMTETTDWVEYLIKIGVSVMLLIIAFFLTAWYNDIKKSNNEVTQAIKNLTLETKLLQQMNKQFTNDIKVLYKRQNQLIDWKNKHNVLHASYHDLNTKK